MNNRGEEWRDKGGVDSTLYTEKLSKQNKDAGAGGRAQHSQRPAMHIHT